MSDSPMKHIKLLIILVFALTSTNIPSISNAGQDDQSIIQTKLAGLEETTHGRLGVYAINTANNQSITYRANERFPLCSTNKLMGVAAILKKSMTDSNLLQRKIHYKQSDLVVWSPVTKKHLHSGMTIAALSKAAITLSDNAAINLLMKQLGGPKAVMAFVRDIGDDSFRLDRFEPELNSAIPGDLRDTSTPAAMGNSLRKLVLGNVLAPEQRELLQTWLKDNTTGNARIRAGVPKGWLVGDKTGTCGHYGVTNDIGSIWPKRNLPIILAIYFTQNKEGAPSRDDVIASTTRIVLHALSNDTDEL